MRVRAIMCKSKCVSVCVRVCVGRTGVHHTEVVRPCWPVSVCVFKVVRPSDCRPCVSVSARLRLAIRANAVRSRPSFLHVRIRA